MTLLEAGASLLLTHVTVLSTLPQFPSATECQGLEPQPTSQLSLVLPHHSGPCPSLLLHMPLQLSQ
eukprot:30356-Eustigmatos_ZCMA.PRE.1